MNELSNHPVVLPQVLVVAAESGHLSAQLDALHHIAVVPSLPLHPHIRPARNAAVRRRVELQGGHAAGQLQQLHSGAAHSVPGEYLTVFIVFRASCHDVDTTMLSCSAEELCLKYPVR